MKKLIIISLVVALFVPLTTLGALNDVNNSTSYYNSIKWMSENGVIQGYPDGSFKPDKCVNRVEILKMLFLAHQTTLSEDAISNPFKDTDTKAWYWPYLKTAYKNGVVKGYADGTFKPSQCVNRVEAMKMAMEEFNIQTESLPGMGWSYADVDPTAWYIGYFYVAVKYNLIGRLHEYLDPSFHEIAYNFFSPSEGMTRKEVAEMLYRMKAVKDNSVSQYSTDLQPIQLPKSQSTNGILTYNGPAQFKLDSESIPCSEYAYDSITCTNNPNGSVSSSRFYLELNPSDISANLSEYIKNSTLVDVGCVDTFSMYGDMYTFDKYKINIVFYQKETKNIHFEIDSNQPARGDIDCVSPITKVYSIE